MSKHTPGPWNINKLSYDGLHVNIRAEVFPALARVHVETETGQANARLIAEAPMLLECLKRIVASAPIKGLPMALEIDIQAACEAIARAEGGY